jgi:DNA-binding response OmpR family regulator
MKAENKGTVLVIDDDAAVTQLFSQTVAVRGITVVSVADPDEGVEKAKELVPDIIFMGLLFRGSNGLKVSKQIHADEKLRSVPIVMLTSYHGELDPKYTATLGIVDVIVKPLDADEVLSKLPPSLRGRDVLPDKTAEKEEEKTLDEGITPEEDEGDAFEMGGLSADAETAAVGREKATAGPAGDDFLAYELEEGEEPRNAPGRTADEFGVMEHEPTPDMGHAYGPDMSYASAERKSLLKKLVPVLAVVVIIAGLGIAAFLIKDIFFAGGGKQPTPPPVTAVQPQGAVGPGESRREPGAAGDKGKTAETPAPREEASPAEKPVPAEVQAPAKAAEPREVKTGAARFRFAAQVGVFQSAQNAAALGDELSTKGYDAFVVKEQSGSRTLHRVLVGRFDDSRKAQEQVRILARQEGIKAVIYRYR